MKYLKLITTFLLSGFLFPNNVLGQEGPAVEIWYEEDLRFGYVGTSQVWVNILGNVSDPEGDYFSKPKVEEIFDRIYATMSESDPAGFPPIY